MEMAPSGFMAYQDTLDTIKNNNNNYFPVHSLTSTSSTSTSSLLLSPFPSVLDCGNYMKPPSSFIHCDHDYFIRNIDEATTTVIHPPLSPTSSSSTSSSSSSDAMRINHVEEFHDFEFDSLVAQDDSLVGVMTSAKVLLGEGSSNPCPSIPTHGNPKVSLLDSFGADQVTPTLSSQHEEFVTSNDTDFLQGLDEIDFDLECLDQCQEVGVVNSFQSFIDATLDDHVMTAGSCDLDVSEDLNGGSIDENEDVYKEFFFKHLGLQRVTSPRHTISPRLDAAATFRKAKRTTRSQHNNRKRKYAETEEVAEKNIPNTAMESIVPLSPVFNERLQVSQSTLLSPFLSSRVSSDTFTFNPSHNYSNPYTTTTASSSNDNKGDNTSRCVGWLSHEYPHNLLPATQCVPVKRCSLVSHDWRRSVLYSTAKSSVNTSVSISPSTAYRSRDFPYRHNSSSAHSDIPSSSLSPFSPQSSSSSSLAVSNLMEAILPDSLNLPASSSLSSSSSSVKSRPNLELDLLDNCDIDDDTRELLQWLDDHENVRTTIAAGSGAGDRNGGSPLPSRTAGTGLCESSAAKFGKVSHAGVGDLTTFAPTFSTNLRENSKMLYTGSFIPSPTTDATPVDAEPLPSPKRRQAYWDMEAFTDLESYVTEEGEEEEDEEQVPSPVKMEDGENNNNKDLKNFRFVPKSQHRLSILADISRDFLNSEYNEKKDAIKRDILKSWLSDSDHMTNSVPTNERRETKLSMFPRRMCCHAPSPIVSPLSPLSSLPSSPSSLSPYPSEVSSSPLSSPSSKNLELLDLFSDDNASWFF